MFYVLIMMEPLLMGANHLNSTLIANNPTMGNGSCRLQENGNIKIQIRI